jgi:hypothetical protein
VHLSGGYTHLHHEFHDLDHVIDDFHHEHDFEYDEHNLDHEHDVKHDLDNLDDFDGIHDFVNHEHELHGLNDVNHIDDLIHKLHDVHSFNDFYYFYYFDNVHDKLDNVHDLYNIEYNEHEHNHNDNHNGAIMLEPKDIAVEDAAYWANLNKIKLQGGQWSFDDRPYLREPMQMPMLQRMGKAPRKMCSEKATQGGWTELEVNEVLHGQIYGWYPRGVMYLFPTNDEVREFSKTRFNPLISGNPSAIGQYVKDTDTANLKNVNGSMLYFRGARLSLHMEANTKGSSKLSSIPVDKVVFDELDMMDAEDVIVKAEGRMGDSTVKASVFLSNPTIPERGIAIVFGKSDQRHWHRKCGCGAWTCAEEEFPDLVAKDKDGRGYIACKKCGKPTDFRTGEWVPKFRDKSDYMWGYHWSQLTSARNDPLDILHDYNDPPNGNIGDVVRLRLGRPFISAEDRLTVSQILSLCSNVRLQADAHAGPCAMGVDVRRHKNVVIGYRSGRDRYSIARVARVSEWEDILRMAQRFNVRSCVVDIQPYEDSARQFQKKMKAKTWLCQYRESAPAGTQYHESTGIVTCCRTEICDATHRLISDEKSLELPADCPEIRQFARECCNMAKVEVIDKRTKQIIYRYVKLGEEPDDYRHALNYFYLAAAGGRLSIVSDRWKKPRQTHAINEYSRD